MIILLSESQNINGFYMHTIFCQYMFLYHAIEFMKTGIRKLYELIVYIMLHIAVILVHRNAKYALIIQRR